MAKCPTCGTNVASPRKTWKMPGKKIELKIGLFDCPKCKKPFRVALEKRRI